MTTASSRSVRSAYRTEAVIDWLALEIEVEHPTQFQWLQRILATYYNDDTRPYIDALDAGAGRATTKFLIRLNDAQCRDISTIRGALAALDRQYKLVGPVMVKTLEVALDFYPNDDHARAELRRLVGRLQKCLAAYGTNHRQIGSRKQPEFIDSTRNPDPNATFYINNKTDTLSWRVYHKITDRDHALPSEQHRARVEFTLQGAGLSEYGISTLDDLAEHDFANFGHLLHFRQFRPMSDLIAGKNPAVVYALRHGTRHNRNTITLYPFGRNAYRLDKRTGKPRNGGRPEPRNHSTHTVADDELNHLVRDRLRGLTQRFRKNLEAKS